jgi:hypothetical protein
MKATYRFFEHESITMEKLLQPHYQATTARVRMNPSVVLAVQDTTELNYDKLFDQAGQLQDERTVEALEKMLAGLARWVETVRPLRD